MPKPGSDFQRPIFEAGQTVVLHGLNLHRDWNGRRATIIDGPIHIPHEDRHGRFTAYLIEAPDGRALRINAERLWPEAARGDADWSHIERLTGWNPTRSVAK